MRLGWLPDPPDARDRDASPLLASLPTVIGSDDVDWRAFDSPRVQIANSCVGHAIAASAALCMAIAGTPIAFPSALYAYAGARLLAQPKRPLLDEGSIARLAMLWGRDRGLVAEERWPETQANVNAVPPLDSWQAGEGARVTDFARIAEGRGAAESVRAALRRGFCPVFAMVVDTKYEAIGRGVYDGPDGGIIGGHMQCVVGTSSTLDALLVRNTWGTWFGDGGYAWISAACFDRVARDIWVVRSAPEVR